MAHREGQTLNAEAGYELEAPSSTMGDTDLAPDTQQDFTTTINVAPNSTSSSASVASSSASATSAPVLPSRRSRRRLKQRNRFDDEDLSEVAVRKRQVEQRSLALESSVAIELVNPALIERLMELTRAHASAKLDKDLASARAELEQELMEQNELQSNHDADEEGAYQSAEDDDPTSNQEDPTSEDSARQGETQAGPSVELQAGQRALRESAGDDTGRFTAKNTQPLHSPASSPSSASSSAQLDAPVTSTDALSSGEIEPLDASTDYPVPNETFMEDEGSEEEQRRRAQGGQERQEEEDPDRTIPFPPSLSCRDEASNCSGDNSSKENFISAEPPRQQSGDRDVASWSSQHSSNQSCDTNRISSPSSTSEGSPSERREILVGDQASPTSSAPRKRALPEISLSDSDLNEAESHRKKHRSFAEEKDAAQELVASTELQKADQDVLDNEVGPEGELHNEVESSNKFDQDSDLNKAESHRKKQRSFVEEKDAAQDIVAPLELQVADQDVSDNEADLEDEFRDKMETSNNRTDQEQDDDEREEDRIKARGDDGDENHQKAVEDQDDDEKEEEVEETGQKQDQEQEEKPGDEDSDQKSDDEENEGTFDREAEDSLALCKPILKRGPRKSGVVKPPRHRSAFRKMSKERRKAKAQLLKNAARAQSRSQAKAQASTAVDSNVSPSPPQFQPQPRPQSQPQPQSQLQPQPQPSPESNDAAGPVEAEAPSMPAPAAQSKAKKLRSVKSSSQRSETSGNDGAEARVRRVMKRKKAMQVIEHMHIPKGTQCRVRWSITWKIKDPRTLSWLKSWEDEQDEEEEEESEDIPAEPTQETTMVTQAGHNDTSSSSSSEDNNNDIPATAEVVDSSSTTTPSETTSGQNVTQPRRQRGVRVSLTGDGVRLSRASNLGLPKQRDFYAVLVQGERAKKEHLYDICSELKGDRNEVIVEDVLIKGVEGKRVSGVLEWTVPAWLSPGVYKLEIGSRSIHVCCTTESFRVTEAFGMLDFTTVGVWCLCESVQASESVDKGKIWVSCSTCHSWQHWCCYERAWDAPENNELGIVGHHRSAAIPRDSDAFTCWSCFQYASVSRDKLPVPLATDAEHELLLRKLESQRLLRMIRMFNKASGGYSRRSFDRFGREIVNKRLYCTPNHAVCFIGTLLDKIFNYGIAGLNDFVRTGNFQSGPPVQENRTMRCADLGAGVGALSSILPRGSTCIEIDEERFSKGSKRYNARDWILGDVLNASIYEPLHRKFDLVIANPDFEVALPFLCAALYMLRDHEDARILFLLPSDYFEASPLRSRCFKLLPVVVETEFKLGHLNYLQDDPLAQKLTVDSLFVIRRGRLNKFVHTVVNARLGGML